MAGISTGPLTPDRFSDLEAVLRQGGISGCWCMYWVHETGAQWSEGAKGGSQARNKQSFRDIVEHGPPPGIVAYDDGEPVAWCRVMARSRLPGLARSRHFENRPRYRRRVVTPLFRRSPIAPRAGPDPAAHRSRH